MVIFHSYVSLPEGNMIILEMDEANQKHTAEKPDKVPWLSRAFTRLASSSGHSSRIN
jgi:hypothetical protein